MLIDINFVNAMNDILSYIASIAGALGVASTIVYAVIKYIHDFFERKAKAQDEYLSSFNRIVAQLNSKNRATISANTTASPLTLKTSIATNIATI